MKCVVCKAVLSGLQKKYCSNTCGRHYIAGRNKRNFRKANPLLPKLKCVLCSRGFQPRSESHICCNAMCRRLWESSKRNKNPRSKKKPTKMPKFWVPQPIKVTEPEPEPKPKRKPLFPRPFQVTVTKRNPKRDKTLGLKPLPILNSGYIHEIQEFLKNGGKIDLNPPQVNGRTPDVNVHNLSGWSVESMYGFGYEIEIMDLLSESTDAV